MSSTAYPDALAASWLAHKLAIEPMLIEAMRRDGELIAVREPGGTEWYYPSWQFENGAPLSSVQRVTRAAREAKIDHARLYTILTARRGLQGPGKVYELLHEGRDDEVVELVRAG